MHPNASTLSKISRKTLVPALALAMIGGFASSAAAAPSGSPFGNGFDRLEGVSGGIRTKGWAIDPNTSSPIKARVSIDGATKSITADDTRTDVERAFPGNGANHGWDSVLAASPGSHTVCVTAENVSTGTDTALGCRTVTVPASATVAGAFLSTRPGSTNTGVPAGKSLSVHNGDLTITTPGTVIDGLDIRGYVNIKADNVTIRNSIIRGGAKATTHRAIVAAWWGKKNITIQDTTIKAANPSVYIDGLSGSGFTARRLDISGVIDPVKVIGDNVTVTDSWLHNNLHYTNDPTQSDGKSHDDSIQIQRGKNITISRNTITNAHNAAIMVTQDAGTTSGVSIEKNWISGGVCTVNIKGGQGTFNSVSISSNSFGHGSEANRCPMRLPSGSGINATSNVWDTNGSAVKPNWF